MSDIEIILPTDAEIARAKIYSELNDATANVFKLEQSWTRLGIMLRDFKAAEHWRRFPALYGSFDDFMSELKTKYNRGRTQLYGYLGVAENLLPTISASTLEEMGISKALELKRAIVKLGGKPLPPEVIEAAQDPNKTTKELRGDIGKALNLNEEPSGTWFDLDGFFITAEERTAFKEAVHATEGILGLTKAMPDHVRRKRVIMAWMEEWFGTHAPEFYGKDVVSTTAVLVNARPSVPTPEPDATGYVEELNVV